MNSRSDNSALSGPRFLVVRYSSMGDVLLTTPIIRMLYKQIEARIDVLTKFQYGPIFHNNPYINKVYFHEKCTIGELRQQKYLCIIDLQKSLRSFILGFKLGLRRYTFNKQYVGTFLYLKWRKNWLEQKHMVHKYMEAIAHLDILDDGLGLNLFGPFDLRLFSDLDGLKYTVLVVGGTHITKRIPKRLVDFISRYSNRNFVIIGGSDVADLNVTNRENLIDLSGKTSLEESIAIIEGSELVITGDTGMMHVAAAFNKPIVTVWGSTSPVFGFYPYYGRDSDQKSHSVSKDLDCQPCSKYGRKSCPFGHMNCLNELDGNEILQIID